MDRVAPFFLTHGVDLSCRKPGRRTGLQQVRGLFWVRDRPDRGLFLGSLNSIRSNLSETRLQTMFPTKICQRPAGPRSGLRQKSWRPGP